MMKRVGNETEIKGNKVKLMRKNEKKYEKKARLDVILFPSLVFCSFQTTSLMKHMHGK